jgi:hypothetical protein
MDNLNKSIVPRNALIGSPALFIKDNLICAPLVPFGNGLELKLMGGDNSFVNSFKAY